jgi:hypothetical protein
MPGRRHPPEQIIGKLREAEGFLSQGEQLGGRTLVRHSRGADYSHARFDRGTARPGHCVYGFAGLTRLAYCGPCSCSCEPAVRSKVGARGSNPRPYGCEPAFSGLQFP